MVYKVSSKTRVNDNKYILEGKILMIETVRRKYGSIQVELECPKGRAKWAYAANSYESHMDNAIRETEEEAGKQC